ncbi:hypothetical protein ABZT49_08940 [Methylobacterium sp. EM32]|uniref:hypothetical protein n=1 Tax=Methylobacterium sp. EM32 TaxID=3163481 RepID=UPI0033AA2923
MQALLKDVPVTTRWADLPANTKDRLLELAEDRLAAFRSRWGGEAIERKLKILLDCPTPEMSSAIDEFYRVTYKSVVPETFTLKDVRSSELARVLVETYLGKYAIKRAGMTYPNATLPNRDWDGKSTFDSTLLPDRQAYEDWRRYFAKIAMSLRTINEASLDGIERALRRQILFVTRAVAEGALFGDSFGGSDFETACELVSLNNNILMAYKGDKSRPVIFANDDEVLREINAIYLHSTRLKWLDRGTVNSAINNSSCNSTEDEYIEKYVGPIPDNKVAKGIKLMKAWWIERLSDNPASKGKCTIYSADDRRSIWEAFSADQQFNNDGSSTMETYRTQITAYAAEKQKHYRAVAKLALNKIFHDDTVLTPAQRGDVVAAINKETAFGLMPTKVAEYLDAAQGAKDGPASRMWNEAVQRNVKRLGGRYSENDPVRPQDEATLRTMFDQVREWVSNRYKGYPIDVAAIFPLFEFKATTKNNAGTDTATGNIEFGIGTERSLMEYYSIILHEVRHAVTGAWRANAPDKSKVRADEGAAVEGSGVAVEELLLETFMRETLKDDLSVALYSLDYGIRDARFAGTTDATLRKYFRPGCSDPAEPDTIEFAKAIANEYGLTGQLATNVALRAHTGTQYFQYISGGLQILEDIAYLQGQLDLATKVRLDPFVLLACNLNTPLRSPEYTSELKACLRNKT